MSAAAADPAVADRLAHTLAGHVGLFALSRPERIALREKKLGLWQEVSWASYFEQIAAAGRMMWHRWLQTPTGS